jgi:sporulation protein YlmC with PRC-barrel domain
MPAVLLISLAVPAFLFTQQGQAADELNRRLVDLVDTRFHNRTGGIEGEVEDAVITMGGAVTHLVIRVTEAGERLDLDRERFLIPIDRMAAGAAENALVILDLDPRELLDLPVLDDGELPGELAARLDSVQPILGRDLLDFAFIDAEGEKVGDVKDIVLNLTARRVMYLALSRSGFLGLGESLFAIPLEAVTSVDLNDRQLILGFTGNRLEERRGFARDEWPQEASAWGTE